MMEVTVTELSQLINPPTLSCCSSVTQSEDIGPHIVILHRGWVVVGNVIRSGAHLSISNGHVIRSWGTSNGLGEIALNGPTANTKLDKSGDLSMLEANCIALMKCNAVKWQAVLS